MSYRVYTHDKCGKHLIDDGVDYRTAEYYRSTCRNVVIEDCSNDPFDMPDDATLSATYGVNCDRELHSALIVFGCILLTPVIIAMAWIIH